MKFFLVKNHPLKPSDARPDRTNSSIPENPLFCRYQQVAGNLAPFGNDFGAKSKCAEMTQLLQEVFSKVQQSSKQPKASRRWAVEIQIGVQRDLQPNMIYFQGCFKMSAGYNGNILQLLSKMCGEHVKIKVELEILGCSRLNLPPYTLSTPEMPIVKDGPQQYQCFDQHMRFPYPHFSDWYRSGIQCLAEFSVILDISDTLLHQKLKIGDAPKAFNEPIPHYQKILEEEVLSDVTIVVDTGTEIKAHRSFLGVRSSVFLAMFQTDMNDSRESRVEIPDMEEESVRALLKYLYCNDTQMADKNCLVAIELLFASEKYDIAALGSEIRKLLLNKPNDWYNGDVGVKLFLFARNLTPVNELLKMKAIEVLKTHGKSLEKSPTYQEIFDKDKKAAMELCRYAFMT